METATGCPLCNLPTAKLYGIGPIHQFYRVICDRCGEYLIQDLIADWNIKNLELKKIGYILSGLSREIQDNKGKPPELTVDNIERLSSSYPVPDLDDIEEKVKKFLLALKRRIKFFGGAVIIDRENDFPLAYAENAVEFDALIEYMRQRKFIDIISVEMLPKEKATTLSLSAEGWGYIKQSSSSNTKSEQGFIAIWFDDSMNDSIEAIEDGIKNAGYKPLCIRNEHFAEKIMDKALGEIRNSRFLVIDLTEQRNSVFFEAGFAHGLGIECIYVYKIKKGNMSDSLEFYVKHYQCYGYETAQELRQLVKDVVKSRISK